MEFWLKDPYSKKYLPNIIVLILTQITDTYPERGYFALTIKKKYYKILSQFKTMDEAKPKINELINNLIHLLNNQPNTIPKLLIEKIQYHNQKYGIETEFAKIISTIKTNQTDQPQQITLKETNSSINNNSTFENINIMIPTLMEHPYKKKQLPPNMRFDQTLYKRQLPKQNRNRNSYTRRSQSNTTVL